MSRITRVDEAVTALIAIAKDALPSTVEVLDGPMIGDLAAEALVVGFADTADTPGYEAELIRQDGLGRARYIEAITVRMMLTLASGDDTIPVLRSRAAQYLGLLDDAYRSASTTKTTAWDKLASGGQVKWVPFSDETGSVINAFFDVIGTSLL